MQFDSKLSKTFNYSEKFNEKGDVFMEKLRKSADGKTKVCLLDEFNRVALDVIAVVITLSLFYL